MFLFFSIFMISSPKFKSNKDARSVKAWRSSAWDPVCKWDFDANDVAINGFANLWFHQQSSFFWKPCTLCEFPTIPLAKFAFCHSCPSIGNLKDSQRFLKIENGNEQYVFEYRRSSGSCSSRRGSELSIGGDRKSHAVGDTDDIGEATATFDSGKATDSLGFSSNRHFNLSDLL